MAIEDEIINIADLDVGTELLKTDKLLIETNNGTKLLDFKDFVIGPDNISSVRDDQIEYETTGEAATRNSSTSFSIVSGFKILTTDTTPGLKTSYKDLSGSIELGKFNYNAIEHISTLSAGWEQTRSNYDSIDGEIAAWRSWRDSVDNGTNTLPTLALSAVNFLLKNGQHKPPGGIYFEGAPDVDPRITNPDVTLVTGDAANPFSITYPSEADGSFRASYIFFKLSFKLNSGSKPTIRIYKNDTEEIAVLAFKDLSKNIWDWQHIEYIVPGDKITVYGSKQIAPGSIKFEGFKLAT